MRVPSLVLAGAAALATLSGCSSARQLARPLDYPFYQVYAGTYDTVWNATVRVLDIYSITVASRDSGLLQTEWLDLRYNRELFDAPDRDEALEEVRYRLKIKLSKGVVNQTGDPAVRVQVTKELEQYRNIFTDWQRMPTDEVEERVILYRIGQRLRIAETLKKKSKGAKAPAPAQ